MSAVTPLVSAEWLADHVGDADIVLIDIRSSIDGGGAAAYTQAHIPGAVHTDYTKDGWRATKGTATGLLPEMSFLADLFGRLGLTPARHAVIVSAGTSPGDFCAAARVYWTLKVGSHDRVSILDGGMVAWGDRRVEAGSATPKPAAAYPVKYRDDLRADLAAVERAVSAGGGVLLDSRSANYFSGTEKSPQAKRAGRLPASRLLDHTRVFDPVTKRLRPRAELDKLFGEVPPLPVVNYCNTGHQAAANWFVLSEVLGRPSKLFDGSMTEWTEDEGRPVEVG